MNDNLNKANQEDEEDMFQCYNCIVRQGQKKYNNAYPKKSLFCGNVQNCPCQIITFEQKISYTDSIKIVRQHRTFLNGIDAIQLIHDKVDNKTGKFYCQLCWNNYLECKNMIPYFWSKSPFNKIENNDDNDVDM